ncbi:MAG: hypothetical protein J7J20_06575 [Desulfurococcales archaeon]|nr:hypothetical protein [Desulfurococcales archaeon]
MVEVTQAVLEFDVREGAEAGEPQAPELRFDDFGRAAGVLARSGHFIRADDIVIVSLLGRSVVLVQIARNGAVLRTAITFKDGSWIPIDIPRPVHER